MTCLMKIFDRLMRTLGLIAVLAYTFGPYFTVGKVYAVTLSGGSVALSDGRKAVSSSYTIEFSNITTSDIKCIKVVFSDAASGGSAPTGLSTASATYNAAGSDYIPDAQTWTADGTTTPGTVVITSATAETPASATDGTVLITGITNGSTAETGYFAQFSTYNNTNCSSSGVDSGVGVYIYTTGQAVSLTVNPTLSFGIALLGVGSTVNGAVTTVATTDGTIPFSTISDQANAIAGHELTTSTNAGTGYTASIRYTAAPSDGGSETIDDVSPGTNLVPAAFSANGTEAFGYTTNDATLSNVGDGVDRFTTPADYWAKFTTSNAEIAYNGAKIANDTVRVGYQVGVSATTAAATYTTTVIITCTPQY